MRRKITVFLIIAVCYLLQSTVFQALSFASISPNLMIVVVSAFGFMRGKKEGLWIGFFTGLLLDIFTGSILGFYALLYMYVGYFNGFFRKMFYPEDIKLPMLLIAMYSVTEQGNSIVSFKFTLDHYVRFFTDPDFLIILWRSIWIAV